jgi:hypothetical protein
MEDNKQKSEKAKQAPAEDNTTTIGEFLSGLVEVGHEKQGIRYEVYKQPVVKQTAAN